MRSYKERTLQEISLITKRTARARFGSKEINEEQFKAVIHHLSEIETILASEGAADGKAQGD